ncbi:uncharacterized protein [Eleutherodactylus coqui]|uniref:uncharacterized protein isoform X1 n=1 Tax=Eleutherodactylus coqui TaxID=57060 RepID=UPI003462F530
MDHVQCTQEHHNGPTQEPQGDVPKNVEVEEEEVICVKIKEEEIPIDISPDPGDNIIIYRDLDIEGGNTSLNTWEKERSINTTKKRRQTRWGSRNIRDTDSESNHHEAELYESSESSQAGPSQFTFTVRPINPLRHDTGRITERGSKRSRKRKREEAEFMVSVLHRLNEMNEERSRHRKEMMSQQEIIMRQLRDDDDSDLLFLKSLLPLMKEMPTPKKMECWTAMMDVMARFLAPSSTTHPPSPAPGSFSHAPSPHVPPLEPWYGPSGYSSGPSHSQAPHSRRLIADLGKCQYYPT